MSTHRIKAKNGDLPPVGLMPAEKIVSTGNYQRSRRINRGLPGIILYRCCLENQGVRAEIWR
jgi:hypothetical protein